MDIQPLNINAYGSSQVEAMKAVERDPAVIKAKIKIDSNKEKVLEPHEVLLQENKTSETDSTKFEELITMEKAALLSLEPEKFELLLKYVEILRTQRFMNQKPPGCGFCKNNGEPSSWYTSHVLRDNRNRVRCPVLRGYRCPLCGATGDNAHTLKYCFLNDDRSSTSSKASWKSLDFSI